MAGCHKKSRTRASINDKYAPTVASQTRAHANKFADA